MHDDRLRLIFTCCHPALAPAAQVALTLRLLGGLTTPEIARAFMVPEATHGAAHRAGQGEDPRRRHSLPGPEQRRAARPACGRCSAVVYLVFNEGYAATSGDALVREDLCAEAIRLGRTLAELMPDEPEVVGLARADAAGRGPRRRRAPAPTARWCRCASRTAPSGTGRIVAEGQRARPLRACAATCRARTRCRRPSTPCTAMRHGGDDTDWRQILALYDQLLVLDPSPVVALNRAVAVAEVEGPAVGALTRGGGGCRSTAYYLLPRRAAPNFLRRLGPPRPRHGRAPTTGAGPDRQRVRAGFCERRASAARPAGR